jgi:hypothetical protein
VGPISDRLTLSHTIAQPDDRSAKRSRCPHGPGDGNDRHLMRRTIREQTMGRPEAPERSFAWRSTSIGKAPARRWCSSDPTTPKRRPTRSQLLAKHQRPRGSGWRLLVGDSNSAWSLLDRRFRVSTDRIVRRHEARPTVGTVLARGLSLFSREAVISALATHTLLQFVRCDTDVEFAADEEEVSRVGLAGAPRRLLLLV